MATTTNISWTEQTWNPITGCAKVSAGCKHCYAETMSNRLKAMGANGYDNGFKLSLMPERLNQPLKRKKPTTYFVNSMSDLFHEDVPFDYITEIMSVIRRTPHHNYQILTKRADIMRDYFSSIAVPKNVWLGVSVENIKEGLPRIEHLQTIFSANWRNRFLSIEPLLEDLGELDLHRINWVIVGGESGTNARQMKKEWVMNIKRQCDVKKVPFFFKQWGVYNEDGVKSNVKKAGCHIDGKIYHARPEGLR